MLLKTTSGATADISVEEVLRAAGAVYARRRKVFGGPPKHEFHCRWCSAACLGRAALSEHERTCAAKPSGEFTEADLRAMGLSETDVAAMAWALPNAS
jgi:hypothetical protein